MSFGPRPATGFVLGKFMPPHQGHVFLCDFARAYCERLTILVCSLPDDPIAGALRHRWMSELFPDCRVLWCEEPLPQAPADDPEFWPIWRDVVRRYAGPVEVVFAGEPYGARLASEVGARFVPMDRDVDTIATSGTAVRRDPFANWSRIPAPVRPHFVKRVCLFGPESTGKTRLAAHLAARFDTLVAPEYGRIHTAAFGAELEPQDLRAIVQGHLAGVAAAKRQANRILIEDTDPLLTAVWSDMLFGERDPWFESYDDLADLYLLCDVDVPWEDDGTRYFPDPDVRRRFFDACEAELTRRAATWRRVSGPDFDARRRQAVDAVIEAFPGLRPG
jgi:NadR type nicotinamide-nucleotide adenylyltransferase